MDFERKTRGTEIQRNQQRVFLSWDYEICFLPKRLFTKLTQMLSPGDCFLVTARKISPMLGGL